MLYRYDHNSDKFSSVGICVKNNIHIMCHEHISDKFSSVGNCVKNNIHIMCHEHFLNLNALKCEVSCENNKKQTLTSLLVYQRNGSNTVPLKSKLPVQGSK